MASSPYRAGVKPGGSPMLPGARAEAFGAGIGRGLEEAGHTLDRMADRVRADAEREKQRARDEEALAAGLELAKIEGAVDRTAIDARSAAAPGGAGHSDAIGKQLDEVVGEQIGKLKDPKVRGAFQTRYQELRDRVYNREYGWEVGERVGKLAADFDETGTTYANAQTAAPTPEGLQSALKGVETAGALITGVGDDVKKKLIKEQSRKIAVAWSNGMQVKDPRTLVEALNKNLIPHLQPGDIDTLRAGGLVEIRRLEAEQRLKANIGEQQAREEIAVLKSKVSQLGYVPTPEETAALRAKAKTYGLDTATVDLAAIEGEALFNRGSRTWSPQDWEQAEDRLTAKGDKRTPEENFELKLIQQKRPAAVGRYNSDPHAAASAAGNPAPAIDWATPNVSAERRVTWARSFARAAGLSTVPYLDKDEIEPLRAKAASGAAGQLEVAGELRTRFGTAIADEILRTQMGDNGEMRLMVGLPPTSRNWLARGADALKRNPKLFDSAIANEVLATEFGNAIPQEAKTPIFNAAKSIVAGFLDHDGTIEPKEDDFRSAFRAALQRAAGADFTGTGVVGKGGFVDWNGQKLWAPRNLAPADMIKKLSRAKPSEIILANTGTAGDGKGGAPYYEGSDGKLVPMQAEHLRLPDYKFEAVRPGIFRLRGRDGNYVVNKRGEPWMLNVGMLP